VLEPLGLFYYDFPSADPTVFRFFLLGTPSPPLLTVKFSDAGSGDFDFLQWLSRTPFPREQKTANV
jgi:hypothetical protein